MSQSANKSKPVYLLDDSFSLQASEVLSQLSNCTNWQTKYKTIMQFGKSLAPLDETELGNSQPVQGCESPVWLFKSISTPTTIKIWSESKIVNGLIAIILAAYKEWPNDRVRLEDYMRNLAIEQHLSPSRVNGLASITAQLYQQ